MTHSPNLTYLPVPNPLFAASAVIAIKNALVKISNHTLASHFTPMCHDIWLVRRHTPANQKRLPVILDFFLLAFFLLAFFAFFAASPTGPPCPFEYGSSSPLSAILNSRDGVPS